MKIMRIIHAYSLFYLEVFTLVQAEILAVLRVFYFEVITFLPLIVYLMLIK